MQIAVASRVGSETSVRSVRVPATPQSGAQTQMETRDAKTGVRGLAGRRAPTSETETPRVRVSLSELRRRSELPLRPSSVLDC